MGRKVLVVEDDYVIVNGEVIEKDRIITVTDSAIVFKDRCGRVRTVRLDDSSEREASSNHGEAGSPVRSRSPVSKARRAREVIELLEEP